MDRRHVPRLPRAAMFLAALLFLPRAGAALSPDEPSQKEEDRALLNAVTGYQLEPVRTLVDRGADVNARDRQGRTPLLRMFDFAYGGSAGPPSERITVIRYLLDRGADIQAHDAKGRTALIAALEVGDREIVEELAARGRVDLRDPRNPLSLACAVVHGDVPAARSLLDRGADVNGRDSAGNTALLWAARRYRGREEFIPLFLKRGADADAADADGRTALIYCSGDPQLAARLLEAGARINQQDRLGHTALYTALGTGNGESARFLLARGADPNIVFADGGTALTQPMWNNRIELVKLLLEAGADPNRGRNYEGDPHLINAINHGASGIPVARLLLAAGADPSATGRGGESAVFRALAYKKTDFARLLLERGADPRCTDRHGVPLLYHLARLGDASLARLAKEKGADLNARDKYGRTPLYSAVEVGDLDAVRILVELGADRTVREDRTGDTLLMLAVQRRNADVIRYLLDRGADVNARNKGGWTILMMARGVPEIEAMLRKAGAKE